MTVAEAHQGLVGPGIVVQHRHFDDTRLDAARGDRLGFQAAHGLQQRLRGQPVGVEANLERGVGQAYVEHPGQLQCLDGAGDRHAAEEGFQRHGLGDLGEQVLVAAEAVADVGMHLKPPARRRSARRARFPG